MTSDCWDQQKARLIDRFTARNFTAEFSLLVAMECKSMPNEGFVDIVNFIIGSRIPNKPPLVQDFRDARLTWEKNRFQRNVYGAAEAMAAMPRQQGLKAYLAREFPGCRTISDAVEVRKHQIQIAKANDPNYDPMRDPKWMDPEPA